MNKLNRLSVIKAAELMGLSPQMVRVGLQNGVFPFGYAVKRKTKYTYYISPTKFKETTGIEI